MNVQAKQPDQHAQIVDPDDLGPQEENEMAHHRFEITCFDAHVVAHLPRVHAVRVQQWCGGILFVAGSDMFSDMSSYAKLNRPSPHYKVWKTVMEI